MFDVDVLSCDVDVLCDVRVLTCCRSPGNAGRRHVLRLPGRLLLTDVATARARSLTGHADPWPPPSHDDGPRWPARPPGHGRTADDAKSAAAQQYGRDGTHTGHPRRLETTAACVSTAYLIHPSRVAVPCRAGARTAPPRASRADGG